MLALRHAQSIAARSDITMGGMGRVRIAVPTLLCVRACAHAHMRAGEKSEGENFTPHR